MKTVEQAVIHFKNVLIKLERERTTADFTTNVDLPDEAQEIVDEIKDWVRGVKMRENEIDMNRIELRNLLDKDLPNTILAYHAIAKPTTKQYASFIRDLKRLCQAVKFHVKSLCTDKSADEKFEINSRYLEYKYG